MKIRLEELAPRTTIYISGPITGISDHNTANFNRARDMINSMPHLYAISPVDTKPDNRTDHAYGRWMKPVVKLMMDCDAIYMLEGWEQSLGARTEHHLAAICGMPIIYEER